MKMFRVFEKIKHFVHKYKKWTTLPMKRPEAYRKPFCSSAKLILKSKKLFRTAKTDFRDLYLYNIDTDTSSTLINSCNARLLIFVFPKFYVHCTKHFVVEVVQTRYPYLQMLIFSAAMRVTALGAYILYANLTADYIRRKC